VPYTVTTCPLAYILIIPVCGSIYLFVCACVVPVDAVSGYVKKNPFNFQSRSTLSKLRNFGEGGLTPPQTTPSVRHCIQAQSLEN